MSNQTETTGAHGVPEWDLGDRLRKALKVADMGVEEMADHLGYTRKTVGDYIGGRTEPKLPVLRVWAMRCGVPLEWLKDGIVPSTGPNRPPGQVIDATGWFNQSPDSTTCQRGSVLDDLSAAS